MIRSLPFLFLALTACSDRDSRADEAGWRATMANRGIGRFQLYQATGSSPGFLLDTVTGCVKSISAKSGLEPLTLGAADDPACKGNFPIDPDIRFVEAAKK
jgi:hypothetical protein